MSESESAFSVHVDLTNPGQFFACCGLLELSDRMWQGAEGWFAHDAFYLQPIGSVSSSLDELLHETAVAGAEQLDVDDDFSSPIELPSPFNLRLDWWKDKLANGVRLKVWAGSMRSVRIARAMQSMLDRPELQNDRLFDHGLVVHDPDNPKKKVEPFYFDARRGANAQARDIGFSPDSLGMNSAAYPAVEFLCLVGLQRFRPKTTSKRRVFEYYTWDFPLEPNIASSAACGLLSGTGGRGFLFENSFRTDQRKHKAFTPATPLVRR